MAEAVATIVGIATFGMQIGEQLYKLRQLYDSLRTAPEDITILLRDCERLSKVLSNNASQSTQFAALVSPGAAWYDCQENCVAALQKLDEIAREVDQQIGKSRFTGSVKALLRQDTITKQKSRLSSVRDDLSLALQSLNIAISYKTLAHTLDQAALLSAVHNLLQQQNAPVVHPPPYQKFATPSVPRISSLDDRIVRASKRSNDDQRASSALGFQSRWLRKAWHLETLRSYGSWTFSLRSWNILSPDDSILEIIRQDNLLEFQKRLSYGLVTMDDRDAKGITLFRTACEHGSTDILEHILTRDSRRNELTLHDAFITGERQQDYKTIFETGVTCYWWASILRSHIKPDYLPAFSLLLRSLEANLLMFDDDVKPSEYVTWLTGCGAAFLTSWRRQFSEAKIQEAVVLLRRLFVPQYKKLDLEERLQCALAVEDFHYLWLFWHFLDQDELDLACVNSEVLQNRCQTVTSYYAELLASHECHSRHDHYEKCNCYLRPESSKLLTQAIQLQDVDRSLSRHISPLFCFLSSFASTRWMERPGLGPFLEALEAALHLWLLALQNSDANLEDYGQKEQDFLRMHKNWSIKLKTDKEEFPSRYWIIRMIGFTYGTQPENWKFYFATSTDEFNHTLLLERIIRRKKRINSFDPSLDMPGAWIDAQEVPRCAMTQYFASSRRKRRRYLRAISAQLQDEDGLFASYCCHGYWYRPSTPWRQHECYRRCPNESYCKQDEMVDKQAFRRSRTR